MVNKKSLMVALDFPPCQSAGVQRTQKFCEYLPDFGWEPHVLTAKPFIYNKINKTYNIPKWLEENTERAYGLNSFKHLSIKGKYLSLTERPDRYAFWFWHAVILGKRIIRKNEIKVIWSTFPCSTSHKIANYLKKYSGLPWVADFRDPLKSHHMKNQNNKSAEKIDRETVSNADLLVFSTKNMAKLYMEVYPDINEDKVKVIENGYNEESFFAIDSKQQNIQMREKELRLLYSGELYDNGRDPSELFKAIHKLNIIERDANKTIKIVFRGVENYKKYINIINSLDLNNYVEFLPLVDYEYSLREMMSADILLVMQGTIFNAQIPGKVYDYLRTCKPILALVDSSGATADLLNSVKHACVADISNVDDIICCIRKLNNKTVDATFSYEQFSRKERTRQLATCLDDLI
jgi:glycosyltransferase involved in cell wall biosynthesis